MVVADGNGLPIGVCVTSAQPHESKLAQITMESVSVPQERGRPKNRPKELIADKAYDSRAFRNWLRGRGIKICIPTFERRKRRSPKRGRPIKLSASYRQRWKIERCFAWMDNCRRLVVRYERRAELYRSFFIFLLILVAVTHLITHFIFKKDK
jgi:transposase